LLYDCCGKLKGLATKLKLTSCNAEEKLLAEQRSKNQCQYVGNYKRKVIGLWTSSKMHVYCCFPTKLSRIVQQEGRKQIGKGWGEPKKPNCSGFTLAELERLDFSKFDLSEFFEDIIKKLKVPNQKMTETAIDIKAGLDRFQSRIKKDMETKKDARVGSKAL